MRSATTGASGSSRAAEVVVGLAPVLAEARVELGEHLGRLELAAAVDRELGDEEDRRATLSATRPRLRRAPSAGYSAGSLVGSLSRLADVGVDAVDVVADVLLALRALGAEDGGQRVELACQLGGREVLVAELGA